MFLPPELLKRVNVSGGVDRGRIYRIVPDDFTQPAPPRLGEATTAELVALLEHPNGWHRDTASRLLYQRQDQTAVPALRRLAATSQIPVARMTALYALDGLGALTDTTLLHAMRDRVAEVRVHAIRLAEGRLASSATLRTRYLELAQDSSLIVRYQLAFSLGELPFTEERNLALATLIVRDGRSSWMRLAVLSSLAQGAADMFRRLAAREAFRRQRHGREFLVALTRQIAAAGQWDEMLAVVGSLEHWGPKEPMLGETITLALLSPQTPTVRKRLLAARDSTLQAIYDRLCRQSKADALDQDLTPGQRALAVRRLGLVEFKGVRETFERLLEPHQPSSVQSRSIPFTRCPDTAPPRSPNCYCSAGRPSHRLCALASSKRCCPVLHGQQPYSTPSGLRPTTGSASASSPRPETAVEPSTAQSVSWAITVAASGRATTARTATSRLQIPTRNDTSLVIPIASATDTPDLTNKNAPAYGSFFWNPGTLISCAHAARSATVDSSCPRKRPTDARALFP